MNKKYFKYINTLFVITPINLIITLIELMRNYGFGEDRFFKLLMPCSVIFPVAYGTTFTINPNARKLAEKTTSK